MNKGDKYVKIVEWSDDDACFIGSCPELKKPSTPAPLSARPALRRGG